MIAVKLPILLGLWYLQSRFRIRLVFFFAVSSFKETFDIGSMCKLVSEKNDFSNTSKNVLLLCCYMLHKKKIIIRNDYYIRNIDISRTFHLNRKHSHSILNLLQKIMRNILMFISFEIFLVTLRLMRSFQNLRISFQSPKNLGSLEFNKITRPVSNL